MALQDTGLGLSDTVLDNEAVELSSSAEGERI